MNNDMMYALFLNSLKKMGNDELKNALDKAKQILNENDYSKLTELVKKERNIEI